MQSKEEFDSVLDTHKAYVKKRFPNYTGSGQDAYADAGDLGADPEAMKADKLKGANGHAATNGHATTNGNGSINGANGVTSNGTHKSSVAVA